MPSWVSKSGLQVSPITLQAPSSGTPLKVVKAYGKYFYELDRSATSPYGTMIKAEVLLPIKTEPSYTILVYAVGRASLTNVIFPIPLRISGVHLFCDASDFASTTKTFNIGNKTTQVNGPSNFSGADIKINLYNLKASFVGNTLNSKAYSIEKTPQRASYDKYINIFGDISNSFVNAGSSSAFFNSLIIGDSSVQNYYNLDSSNLSSSSTNIGAPSTSVKFVLETAVGNPRTSITPTELDQFSLYFVEMFSYIEGYESGSRTLKLQTFVNGMLTYDGSMALSNSVAVNNPIAAAGGQDGDSIEELKLNSLGQFGSQLRTVTQDDYLVRALSMPSQYGTVSKAFIQSQKVVDLLPGEVPSVLDLYVLTYNANRQLATTTDALKQNLSTYLSQYRMINDSIRIKDAFIINIGVDFDIIVLPNYNNNDVLFKCITAVKDYFNIDNW